MKKLFIYSCTVLLLITSCRKSDIPGLPNNARVPDPLITVDKTSDATISVQTADAFNGKFTVALYNPTDVQPAKFDIVMIKNNDATKQVTLAAGITTFPTSLSVTGVQLRTLFGNTAIALGDSFTIGANITTQDGTFYPAFPLVGSAYNSTILTQPGFSPTVTFTAVCKFVMTDYGAIGSTVPYVVVQDDWADYTPGQVIPVTIIDATHMSFFYATNHPKPIIITIDPVTNVTSVAKVDFGDYGNPPAWPYGDIFAQSVPGSADFVYPCSLTVSVTNTFTVAAGSFGNATIVLKKQ